MKTHYETLGVPENASRQEIRRAYLREIRKYHPDLNPGSEANRITAQLNEAYDILSDAEKRKAYDIKLHAQEPSRRPPHPPAPPRPSVRPAARRQILPAYVLLVCIAVVAALLLGRYWNDAGWSSLPPQLGTGLSEGDSKQHVRHSEPRKPAFHLATGVELQEPLDTTGPGELTIVNQTSEDAVAYLYEVNSRRIVRSFYLQEGSEYTETGIADGRYRVSFATGTDWNFKAGIFNRDAHVRPFAGTLEYSEEPSGPGGDVRSSHYEIRLQPAGRSTAEPAYGGELQ